MTGFVVEAWLPLLVWQQVDEPRYQKGFITVSCISVALVAHTMLIKSLNLPKD